MSPGGNEPMQETTEETRGSPQELDGVSECGVTCGEIQSMEDTSVEMTTPESCNPLPSDSATVVSGEVSDNLSPVGENQQDVCLTSKSGGTVNNNSDSNSKADDDQDCSGEGSSPVVNHVSVTEPAVNQSPPPASETTQPITGESSPVSTQSAPLMSTSTSQAQVSTVASHSPVTGQETVSPLVNVYTILPPVAPDTNPDLGRNTDDEPRGVQNNDGELQTGHLESNDAICNGPCSSVLDDHPGDGKLCGSQLEETVNCVEPLSTLKCEDNEDEGAVLNQTAENHVDGGGDDEDEKLGKGVSIMKPLKDREDEVQDEEMVTTPDMKRVKMRQLNNKCREAEELGNTLKSDGVVPEVMGEDLCEAPSPPPMVHADTSLLSLHRTVQRTKPIKTSSASAQTHSITVSSTIDLANKTEAQLSHFVQKSLKTPTLIKSSHGIMDPCFTDNLTESVQKVMSLPSMDHNLPTSLNHTKLTFPPPGKTLPKVASMKVSGGGSRCESDTENVHKSPQRLDRLSAVNETVCTSSNVKRGSPSPSSESLVNEHSYSARLPGTSSADESRTALNCSLPEALKSSTPGTPSESCDVRTPEELGTKSEAVHTNEQRTDLPNINPVTHSSKFTAKSNNKFIRLDFSGHSSLSANEVTYIEPSESQPLSPDKKNESHGVSALSPCSNETTMDSSVPTLAENKTDDLLESDSVVRMVSPSVTSERMATRSSGRRQVTSDDVEDQVKANKGSKRKLTEEYGEGVEKHETDGDLLCADEVIILEDSSCQTKQPHASNTGKPTIISKKGMWKVENHRTMLATRNTTKLSRKDAKALSAGEELSEEDEGEKFIADIDNSHPLSLPISKRSVRACRVPKVDKSEASVTQPPAKRRKASR